MQNKDHPQFAQSQPKIPKSKSPSLGLLKDRSLWIKSFTVTIAMKSIAQYGHVVIVPISVNIVNINSDILIYC